MQDSFLFAYVNRDSDNESEIGITARVDGINAPNYPNPYAGVMIRKFGDTTQNVSAATTRFAAIVVTKDKKVLFLHRDVDGGATTQDGPLMVTFPCFVRLMATKIPGESGFIEFVGHVSDDGIDWKLVSAMTKIAIDGQLMVGLAVTAQLGKVADTTTDQAHASFSKVAVVPEISNVTSSPPMTFDIGGSYDRSLTTRNRELSGLAARTPRRLCEDLTMIVVMFLGLALGLDSFRASLAMGASGLGAARASRMALAFGVCDGVAPLFGLALNRATSIYVASWSELIAPVLLIGFGTYVLLKRWRTKKASPKARGPFSGCRSS